MDIVINIAKDYSDTPGGRYESKGPFSGEDFRKRMLIPKFLEARNSQQKLIVNFDGGYGYSTSFLEEAFGGLVRCLRDPKAQEMVLISQEEPSIIEKVRKYMQAEIEKLGR